MGGKGDKTLWVLSFRQLDELIQLASGAGWRVVGARRSEGASFADSGATVAVVDARGSLAEGLAVIRALAPEVETAGAALLALLSRGDAGAIADVHDAGATHFLLSPAAEGEFIQAIRFAERLPERLGKRAGAGAGRRRSDPVPVAAVADAARRWATGRLAAGRPVAIARVALASFDLVNSAHGRIAGDAILAEVANRLREVAERLFGDETIIARAPGPEFLLAGDGDAIGAEALAAEVSRALGAPFGRAVVGARIGAARSSPGDDGAAVIRRAGERSAAVEAGASLDELAIDLHRAIGDRQIAALFQPQVEIATGLVVGAEALARWTHPRLGVIGADALFAAAERAGVAPALSELVQRLALEAAARWPALLGGLRLSVNVTAGDMAAADFAERFLDRVRQAGFPVERLTVEVTETELIADLERAGALLARLRAAGCRTAIDDFGSGYSSLAYLNALPLDYLKLDKALVRGIEREGRERVVARGVLQLARALGLRSIAEGVETAAQRDLLGREGCELFQGYLCAGAVGADELAALVTRPPSPARG